ncbi:hypothetical protein [Hydrogenovibrio kuenenii]|uniref:hypothetical protein n=1 Tax=Hydrogenovibrio kuenenii TaxID=63658 RepID=UPI000463A4C9|nr:hypothetical protein [Hydrogenovibrio kuenenii]
MLRSILKVSLASLFLTASLVGCSNAQTKPASADSQQKHVIYGPSSGDVSNADISGSNPSYENYGSKK